MQASSRCQCRSTPSAAPRSATVPRVLVQQQHLLQAQPVAMHHAVAAATAVAARHSQPLLCSNNINISSCRSRAAQQPHLRAGVLCRAGKSAGSSKSQPIDNLDDMDDVILVDDSDDEEEGEFELEDDGFVEFDTDDDVVTDDDGSFDEEGLLGIGSDEDPGPEVLTGNVEWGDKALQVAEAVLQQPDNSNLSLYLFRVLVPSKTIEIRLDKLDDAYGSPGLEDIERFSRALAQGLEAKLGPEAAGEVSFEVSSPGAERTLILPQDLLRFKELPMRVEYMNEVGLRQSVVLNFLELDETDGKTVWELADVKANQTVKGRGLSKKQRMQRFDIPLESLERVRIYVDF